MTPTRELRFVKKGDILELQQKWEGYDAIKSTPKLSYFRIEWRPVPIVDEKDLHREEFEIKK